MDLQVGLFPIPSKQKGYSNFRYYYMKAPFILMAFMLTAISAHPQGAIWFGNFFQFPPIQAPVLGPDGITPARAGSVYVQLQAGRDPNSLAPVGTPVLLGPKDGYYRGGVVTVPMLPPGVPGWFQVLAWDVRAEGFDDAKARGFLYGETEVFPGSTSGPPPELSLPLFALPPMILVPEPPSGALLALGGGLWLLAARRRPAPTRSSSRHANRGG
jgi:hypothetical protein